MINELTVSIFIGMFIFAGALSGGTAIYMVTHFLGMNHSYLHLYCGGVLAGLLAFDLIPETINDYHPIGIYAGLSLGVCFMLLIERNVHNRKYVSFEQRNIYMFLFISLLFHSIPTGVALGMSYANHPHMEANSLFLAILVHHIPEGMVMMISVIVSNVKKKTFVLLCILLSLAVSITTYAGMVLQTDSVKFQTLFLGAAIGTLGYVTFYEILWKGLKKEANVKVITAALLGGLSYILLLQIGRLSH